MGTRDQIKSLLTECIHEYAQQSGHSVSVDDGTRLVGPNAVLDSLGLVMVVTDFEARLNESFETELVLASEKAMSLANSPFRSVTTLSDYAEGLLREAGKP
jgi:acyl carrier protein